MEEQLKNLIIDEMFEEFKKRNIGIGFSIDGCKELHNLQRRYHDLKESYDIIVKNIDKYKKYQDDISSIQVVTKNTLEYICQKSIRIFKII